MSEIYKSEYGDIYYKISGKEKMPVIIFTHGVGMDHNTFEMQVEALESDYRVLVWDLPGHGCSTIKMQGDRFTKMSADCLNGLMIESGVEKAVMAGQSLGSLVVQHFLIKYPEKITAAVHVPGIELKSHIGSWSKIFIPFMMGLYHLIPESAFCRLFGRHRAVSIEVQNYLTDTMRKTGKKLALRITKDMCYDLIDESPRPEEKPLLITYGEKDLFFIKKGSVKWHENAPHARCVKIQNANHILNQDNPGGFNKELINFLESVKKQGAL